MSSYSIGQAARLLGVSGETVRRWADSGRLT
ncbi:helix-turn-helix domain-containing protein, partial [Streptomyces sp. A475]